MYIFNELMYPCAYESHIEMFDTCYEQMFHPSIAMEVG